ncbi:Gamma-aminobutyrate:alpha-ketoglutarate aminotransferase [Campylobacter hepaticus]
MSLTGKVSPYKADFGISSVGIYHALFPNQMYEISTKDAMKSIEYICKSSISPYDIAAIIFEPVQGEGGFNQAPHDFVQELRKFADEYKIVLIADEVQTGFGRTGKIFAMEHYDAKVDMICMAKSMAGGFPLSGVVGKANIMDSPNPGGLGGTYAGSPIGIAAALEVINILKEDNLLERANKLGEQLKANLKTLDCKELAQVRGIGSMVAAEFFKDDKPSPEFAKAVQNYAMEEGLLLLTCGTYGNVIRFLYPLTIPMNNLLKN